jgi:hypothetical protein
VKQTGVNLVSVSAVVLGMILCAASVVLAALGRGSGVVLLLAGGALVGVGACVKAAGLIGRKKRRG